MRILFLVVLFLPMATLAQSKYSSAGKRLFRQALDASNAGDQESAVKYFEECIDEDPDFAEAHLNLAIIYYNRGDFKGALEFSRNAYTHNKYRPEVYVELGKAYLQNKMYDSASVILSRAVTEFGSKSDDVYLHLAKALNRNGESDKAIEYLDMILQSSPGNAAALNERGTSYYNLEDFENAQADLNTALSAAPDEAAIYANLTSLALAMDDSAAAVEYLNKGMQTATALEKVQFLALRGTMEFNSGDHQTASQTFDEAFAIDSENEAVLVNQSSILLEHEEYQLAWEKCNHALELNYLCMQAYFNRGIANEMLRRTEEACLDWEQAFVLGSEKAEEYLNSPTCTE